MGVLGGWAFSDERGTPVQALADAKEDALAARLRAERARAQVQRKRNAD